MKMTRYVAALMALALNTTASDAFAQATIPQVYGPAGSKVPAGATMVVDSSGAEKGTAANPVTTSGTVYSRTMRVTATPTITASSAYAAGNAAGSMFIMANAFDTPQSGILQSLRIKCGSVQTAGWKVYFFNTAISSTFTDKAAPSINSADLGAIVGPFSLTSSDSGLGTETTWVLDGIGAAMVSSDTNLRGLLVTTGTPTFASTSDCSVEATILKD